VAGCSFSRGPMSRGSETAGTTAARPPPPPPPPWCLRGAAGALGTDRAEGRSRLATQLLRRASRAGRRAANHGHATRWSSSMVGRILRRGTRVPGRVGGPDQWTRLRGPIRRNDRFGTFDRIRWRVTPGRKNSHENRMTRGRTGRVRRSIPNDLRARPRKPGRISAQTPLRRESNKRTRYATDRAIRPMKPPIRISRSACGLVA